MADTIFSAIDIGSSKIATIIATQNKDREEARVIGFNSTPSRGVKKGLVVDIDKVTQSLEESIEKAERMAGQKITNTVVSVGGPHISALNSRGVVAVADPQGEISETDINRVIEAARAISLSTTRQIIEVSPRDFVVDGQEGIKNPIGMSGVRLEVETHIITASQTNLKNIDRCLNDLGITNNGFIFAGLSSAEAVLSETEKELGVVLVDIGGGKTDIAMYIDGSLSYSSSLPIGAKHITNDIAVGLRVSLDSAEKIKVYVSKQLEDKDRLKKKMEQINLTDLHLPELIEDFSLKTLVDGIIAPRLEELFKLVGDEIAKSTFLEHVPSGLVVTGGGALTVGISQTAKKSIGLPVHIGIPGNITGLIDEIIDPQFASTVGLILYGQKNIMNIKDPGFKNFNKILKDFTLTGSIDKAKNFFKQFIP